MIKIIFLSFITVMAILKTPAQINADDIIGRWMTAENNMEVEIYKTNNDYKAKVVWIDDSKDKSRPMNTKTDWKNPDETLRSRKVIGLVVMYGLVYNENNNDWEGGRIYDPNSGKYWNASAWITKDGHLRVRGYWGFQFIGKDILFKKVL